MILILDSNMCDVFSRSAQFASGYLGGFIVGRVKNTRKTAAFCVGSVCF